MKTSDKCSRRLFCWSLAAVAWLGASLLFLSTQSFAADKGEESTARFKLGAPIPPLPKEAFTIVVIPDTQHYIGKGTKITKDSTDPVTNHNLELQTRWIRDHKADQNIVFVSHVGDIVDYNVPEQWAVAKQHLDTLRGVVPFGLTVGNHDMTGKGDAHLFQQTFPASSFKSYPWYLGSFEHTHEDQAVSANNVNSAQVFSVGGMDFIHINLECNAPNDVLAWAGEVLEKNASRRAFITTHMDLGVMEKPKENDGYIHDPKGRMRWVKCHGVRGNSAEQMWDRLYRKHANLGIVFSGDQSRVTAMSETRSGDRGNVVYSLLSDYMSEPVLRLYRFVPAENKIHVVTCDVRESRLVEATNYVPETVKHQFTLNYSMTK